jgi:hypothetical protein
MAGWLKCTGAACRTTGSGSEMIFPDPQLKATGS